MNTNLTVLTSIAAGSLLTFTTFAAENDVDRRDTIGRSARYDKAYAERQEQLGNVAKSTDIIGTAVKNRQDEKLGRVDELAVDIESGRIVQLIVSSGGVLGVGDKSVAIPPRAFALEDDTKILRLDVNKEKLRDAPGFEMSKWEKDSAKDRVMENYRYYGQEPYFAYRGEATKDSQLPNSHASSTSFGQVEKATKLVGMSVKNKQDEKLGKVENLMVDLANGRLTQVIISSGGFAGIGNELSAVPPSAFHYDTAQRILHLDTTKEGLRKSPHFKSTEWPNFSDPEYSSQAYGAYRVDPYFSTKANADNTALNVRDRQDNQLNPLDRSGKADIETTQRIRQEILNHAELSLNARNVKVITVDGRVTMRGAVDNEDEKRVLTDIANRIAQTGNVDSQLDVKRDVNPAPR